MERSQRTQDSEGEECWEYPEEGVFGFDRLYRDGLPMRRVLACMWDKPRWGDGKMGGDDIHRLYTRGCEIGLERRSGRRVRD